MDYKQQAERLTNTYADAILRLSYAYLKNTQDAQDVCQTVFVRLLTEPREFESGEHERAYILRMAANACKDLLKSPWRQRSQSLDVGLEVPAPQAGDGSVLEAVNQLPPHYPGRHLPVLLRGLPGCRDRSNPGHPHRNRPHPAGPGTDEAERTFGRIWL